MEIFDIQLCVSVRRNISTHEFLCLCSTEYFDTWVFVFVFSGILVFIKTIIWDGMRIGLFEKKKDMCDRVLQTTLIIFRATNYVLIWKKNLHVVMFRTCWMITELNMKTKLCVIICDTECDKWLLTVYTN